MAVGTISRNVDAPRSLHLGHFAFMRAVVQGVDPRVSWDRYLRVEGMVGDTRQVERTIRWIRDVFAAAARRNRRPGIARLVLMEFALFDPSGRTLPSLSEFIHTQDLENFSEDEQIHQYQQHYGAQAQAKSRQTRLITRQLDALNWLQKIIMQAPNVGDAIANWIHPTLANHLERAGLHTLGDLHAHIHYFGTRWHASIPAIGAGKAARIAHWIAQHGPTIDPPVPADSARERFRRLALTGQAVPLPGQLGQRRFWPLDRLVLPLAVDIRGVLRAPRHVCKIAADDDLAAIRAWLGAKAKPPVPDACLHGWQQLEPLSNTQRAYWKEAERFLQWIVLERSRSLSSITLDECTGYTRFLEAPDPSWCAPRGHPKEHPQWRPFEGPLSVAARRFAVTVLRSLYRYLVRQGYLHQSPWEGIAEPMPVIPASTRQSFDEAGWAVIDRTMAQLPATSVNQRLALAIGLISETRLRLGEVVRARVDSLSLVAEENHWQLQVFDSSGAIRGHALSSPLALALHSYFLQRGLEVGRPDGHHRGTRLLGKATDAAIRAPWAPCAQGALDNTAGIGCGTLRDQIKDFFLLCASTVSPRSPLAMQFATASSEWLRQGRGVAKSGVPNGSGDL